MIKVREKLDLIVQNCFGDTEKAILEYTQGITQMTVQNQMLRFYKTACYANTLQELYIDICFIIKDNYAILDKIRNLQDLLEQILNPKAYDEVTANVGNINKTGSSMNVSQTENTTQGHNLEVMAGKTDGNAATLEKTEGAVSESNELNTLKQIMDVKALNHVKDTRQQPNLDITQPIATTTEGKEKDLLSTDEAEEKPLFQHYSISQNSNEAIEKNYAESQTRTDNESQAKAKSNSAGVNKNTIVRGDLKRLSKTGEQAYQVLTAEIHTLRNKF